MSFINMKCIFQSIRYFILGLITVFFVPFESMATPVSLSLSTSPIFIPANSK